MFLQRLGILMCIMLLMGAWMISEHQQSKPIPENKLMLLFREIGHKTLLQAGDSTSRVLPVQQIDDNNYQLRFENHFTFEPDSLVQLVRDNLEGTFPKHQIMVQVINCLNTEIIYAFEINNKYGDDIVPCLGRKQTPACYIILISLNPQSSFFTSIQHTLTVQSLILLLSGVFIGLLMFRKKKPSHTPPENKNFIVFGRFSFDFGTQTLKNANQVIKLTHKEAKLLNLLASTPNEILDRNILLQKVWEDEGVFVGRSLDVFISRLRKKLQGDDTVRIVNIHGKGYKLQIG